MVSLASEESSAREAASYVRYRTIEGRVVVLDLRAGSYLVLDEVASKMWNLRVQYPREECIDRVI